MLQYHVAKPDGTRVGPYDVETLNAMLASGQLTPDCLVWTEGWADWRPIATVAAVPAPTGGSGSWGPVTAFKTVVLNRYADFEGRASRSEYWWFVLSEVLWLLMIWVLLGFVVACMMHDFSVGPGIATALGILLLLLFLAGLALVVPAIAVTVRRLHDAGYSGWFYLLNFVPYVGGIILFVFMVLPSAPPNQWGRGPKGPVD